MPAVAIASGDIIKLRLESFSRVHQQGCLSFQRLPVNVELISGDGYSSIAAAESAGFFGPRLAGCW